MIYVHMHTQGEKRDEEKMGEQRTEAGNKSRRGEEQRRGKTVATSHLAESERE